MRVHELAKELNISSKELIEKALKIPEEYNLERELNLSFWKVLIIIIIIYAYKKYKMLWELISKILFNYLSNNHRTEWNEFSMIVKIIIHRVTEGDALKKNKL